jgi:hypothetical protein
MESAKRDNRLRLRVDAGAKTSFYAYVAKSASPRDIGAAFGDLVHFGQQVVKSGLTLRQAEEILLSRQKYPPSNAPTTGNSGSCGYILLCIVARYGQYTRPTASPQRVQQ